MLKLSPLIGTYFPKLQEFCVDVTDSPIFVDAEDKVSMMKPFDIFIVFFLVSFLQTENYYLVRYHCWK